MSDRTIAWLGLGLIGLPMAARLAAAGWQVQGFDVNGGRLELAAAKGIAAARSAEDALANARFVFTSMPSEAALLSLVSGLGQVPARAALVETSTVGPQASARAGELLAARGIAYLRAPISGSTALAQSGTLTTFVSGPRGAFDLARPAMSAYSRAQIWLGEGEQARFAKLAVNLMVAVTAAMTAEALALGRKGGIGWEALLELVGESVVASPLVKYKLEPLRRRDFTPAATNALVLKDLDLIVQAAHEAGVPAPLATQVRAMYQRVMQSDLAPEDFFSIVKSVEREAGITRA